MLLDSDDERGCWEISFFCRCGKRINHKIDVDEANPIKQRHFPVAPAVGKLVYKEIDRMLEMG